MTLMREAHDSKASNHQSVAATLRLLQASYIWSRMVKLVTKFVQECQLCQRAREGPNLTPGLLQPLEIPTTAWDTVSMNFITQLPTTSNGKTSVLTIVDSLSKRVRLM